ncbi:hypothetical protein LCGC14_2491270 [marine sediment metagenome]|uniref:Uncharacterized protein n=1 Tax=marine sediment metagenome TaxID=412755 RepID=A0A0F9BSJ9_9ZZZZ
MRAGNSPWRRRINDLLRAVEAHDKAGRKWSAGKNKTTGMIVFHATELFDLAGEILAGRLDEQGYEIETETTTFATFCVCPTPDLDENDVCKNCGTQWTKKETEGESLGGD